MSLLKKIMGLFAVSTEVDLSADESFKLSFSNVVMFFSLVYSLILGFHALFLELQVLAVSNLLFSTLFVSYFLFTYMLQRLKYSDAVVGAILFFFFLDVFVNCSFLGFAGMTVVIYPFVTMILQGRRLGVMLSFGNLALICIYSFIAYNNTETFNFLYSFDEIMSILIVQLISIFVYYVAIRWISQLLYDKIREVIQTNNELRVKSDLIKMLTTNFSSSIENILHASKNIDVGTLSTRQSESNMAIRAACENIKTSIESIHTASTFNIPPIEPENVKINIFSLISNVLALYGTKRIMQQHSVVVSSEVSQNIIGNSRLTRQILLDVLNAVDRRIHLSEVPVRISVTLGDVRQSGEVFLRYDILVSGQIKLDSSDLSSQESRIIETLELHLTKRIVLACEGEFSINQEDDELQIEFTLPYKDADTARFVDDVTPIPLTLEMGERVRLDQANVLIVDDNVINQKILTMYIKNKVGKVTTASRGREALALFESRKFDIILMDLQMPDMDGFMTTRKIRESELAGVGRHVAIIAVTANGLANTEAQCLEMGMNGYISKPFAAEELINKMNECLEET